MDSSLDVSLRLAARRLAGQVGGPLLALDTSGAHGSVFLATPASGPGPHSDAVARLVRMDAAALPSEGLVEVLAAQLEAAGVPPASLACVVVTSGPGSFTGLRVGLATAKGLAYGAGVPLLGISTLAMMAATAAMRLGARRIVPVLDARRGQIYAGCYVADATGRLSVCFPDGTFDYPDLNLANQLAAQCRSESVVVVGEAAVGLPLAAALPAARFEPLQPDILCGLLSARDRIIARAFDTAASITPNYLRLSTPESRLQS